MLFTPRCPCCNKTPQRPRRGFCQHITHLMLMTRCKLNCPSDIMPKDWYIDRIWLIRPGMIQQHHMIYSGPNILRQDCSEGIGCQGSVCFHLLSKYHSSCRLRLPTEARNSDGFSFRREDKTTEITPPLPPTHTNRRATFNFNTVLMEDCFYFLAPVFTLLIYILRTEIKRANKQISISQKQPSTKKKQDNLVSQSDTLVFISWEK